MEVKDCRTKKQKFTDFVEKTKRGVKEKAVKVGYWMVDNKEFVAVAAPAIVGLTRFAWKKTRLKEEKNLKTKFVYDRSGGSYWELRRPLSTRERLELDRRRKHGESTGDILSSMRVLK